MSLDPARRLERLREILPSAYDTRPGESLLGVMLERVALNLAAMDEAQRRVLHDHWLPLAQGGQAGNGAPGALDRLGELFDAPRLRGPNNTDIEESADAYRARLGLTARALFGGMTTPRALLSLALAALGTEACPRMSTRSPAHRRQAGLKDPLSPEAPWVVDATEARGMPIGTRRGCAGCRGGGGACAQANTPPLVEASLVENPVIPAVKTVELAFGRPFEVDSRSLLTDWPIVHLTTLEEPLTNPGLQNRATGETTLFHGVVGKGETLVLFPRLTQDELRPFDSIEPKGHHRWTLQDPGCRAIVRGKDGDRDVSHAIFFISGSQFNQPTSTYAGAAQGFSNAHDPDGVRFAETAQTVRTPRLRPGAESWQLLAFAKSTNAKANATDTGEEFEPIVAPSGGARANIASLRLEWLVRPPATVLLSLLRSPQLDAAERLGAIEVLLNDLDHARAAGVRTLVEIRERPAPAEAAEPAEGETRIQATLRLQEHAAPADRPPAVAAVATMEREQHEVSDDGVSWSGRFDFTPFDWANLE